jgi:spore coat protein U-like protein
MQTEPVSQVRRRRMMTSRAWSNVPIGITAMAGLLLAAGPAAAVVQSETLKVQARIGEACTVTSASLDFGQAVDPEVGKDADGSIEIVCQSETTFGIELSGGSPRFMTDSGENVIEYRLYQDPARTNLWNGGTSVSATISGSGSVPVYGRVPEQTNGQPPGVYTDEVTITLVF